MLNSKNQIDIISVEFSAWKKKSIIIDFKIVLLLNMSIEIHLLVEKTIDTQKLLLENEKLRGLDKLITFYQIEYEEEDDKDFFKEEIDLGLRRRLSNLIEPTKQEIKKPCPVVTFYSYKGGVGRTTTLAFFASWLAIHHNKKVVILDCDFEAPGFSNSNYFKTNGEGTNGVVEYLLNKEYAKLVGQELNIKKDYAYTAGNEFEGKGSIFVIPAGNLGIKETTDENGNEISYNHRKDYLEGLARLDLTGTHHILKQFEEFFEDLKVQLDLSYENSVILIDSRTGFNDTFSVLATLSDIIVGIFGDNEQNKVGLYEFLDSFGELGKNKEIVLANTFTYGSPKPSFDNFVNIVSEYTNNNPNFEDEQMNKKDFIHPNSIYKLEYLQTLSDWGTSREDLFEVIASIQNPTNRTKVFLEKIKSLIDQKIELEEYLKKKDKSIEFVSAENYPDFSISEDIELVLSQSYNQINPVQDREILLNKLYQAFPDSYAHDANIGTFFFRNCMKDIFKRDKFLITGYKGTGKTLMYLAFQNNQITQKLCEYYGEKIEHYLFVNVIPVFDKSSYFDTNTNFRKDVIEKVGKDFFYKNFWLLYTWNSIFADSQVQKLQLKPSFSVFEFAEKQKDFIVNTILNDEKMSLVRTDLEKLDKELLKKSKLLIVSYDQLDFVVKPFNWSEGIAPLINYWRINPFNNIYPKLFLRADIFENQRIGNITNINDLERHTINLAWSKDELFSYWFKFVFQADKITFFRLCYKYGNYSDLVKDKIIKINSLLTKNNQVPTEYKEEILFLVENFFGKFAYRYSNQSISSGYGLSYDWFYNNLADAKDMISIRPFLDLLKNAVEIALDSNSLKYEKDHARSSDRVLSAFYYSHKKATQFYSKAYYEDLAQDKGNEALWCFHDYVANQTTKVEEKVYEFSKGNFNHLLSIVLNKYQSRLEIDKVTEQRIHDLNALLRNNGIFRIEKVGNQEKYVMPFLYRNYFGVKGSNPPRQYSKD